MCLALLGCAGLLDDDAPGVRERMPGCAGESVDAHGAGKVREYVGDGGGAAKSWPPMLPRSTHGVDTCRLPERLADGEAALERAVPRKQVTWFKVQGTTTSNVWWVVTLQPTADEDADLYVMKGDGSEYESQAACLGYSTRTPTGGDEDVLGGLVPDWVAFRRPAATNGVPSAQVAVYGLPQVPSNKRFTIETDRLVGLAIGGSSETGTITEGQSDWFRFAATGGTQYAVNLLVSSGDADIYVYEDSATEFVGENTSAGGGHVQFDAAGDDHHYIRVYGHDPSSHYEVWVTTAAASGYEFETRWGGWGSGDGEFKWATGVAADGAGDVYAADFDNHRIQKFSSSGTLLAQWGSYGAGDGRFNNPYGIALDATGNIYVADTNNDRIQKFDSSGVFVTKWGSRGVGNGEFHWPCDVAVDGAGDIHVADNANHRIQKFSSAGVFITAWGSEGGGDGQFRKPSGVATDGDGYVYVTDAGNDRVQKFTSAGVFVAAWGEPGTGNGEFDEPSGIATDGNADVYVTDLYNHRIQKFSSAGVYTTQWGSEGSGDAQFNKPFGLAVDAFGNVYVGDTHNHRVQKFRVAP